MERKVTVRWRGEVRSFDVAIGKTAHEVISAETRIPRERLKILLKGAQVQEDLGESEELIRKCADGAVAMLMGTPAAQQLDRTHEGWRGGANRGKNLMTDVMTRPGYYSGLAFQFVWSVASTTVGVVFSFFKSMFVKAPAPSAPPPGQAPA
mmetsp:Transcript_57361/g.158022  ORF Transcript_57361/g.158022 Transcript_57361/m.158022 type:complete len:151 (-) Transcript_57361:146-598(-)